MAVEPDCMHCSFGESVDHCLIFFCVPLLLTWLPVSMYTVYQKFMQLAPPCAWLQELQRCRTGMWSLLPVFQRVRGPCSSWLCLFLACKRMNIHFESLCEKYGYFNMSNGQSCFTTMTLRAAGLAVLTAPQIGATIFMPAGSKECPVWLTNFSVQTMSYI